MTTIPKLKWFLIASPWLVLLPTRAVVEISTMNLPSRFSWLPSFAGYYLFISLMFFIAIRSYSFPFRRSVTFSFKPVPKFIPLLFGIIVPALLPITVFINGAGDVPLHFFIFIVIFSFINPVFEEGFWRGLLNHLPLGRGFRVVYSALLFAFSHYFLWGYWFKTMWVIIPTVISTFIMGVLWMWFMQKNRNLLYPILSHIVVDVLNLSIAVYYGAVTFKH